MALRTFCWAPGTPRKLRLSFGRRSADFVSSFPSAGALGLRCGGGGRRKATCEGGGDGVASISPVIPPEAALLAIDEVGLSRAILELDIADGINGKGLTGGLVLVAELISISNWLLVRIACCISSWKRPALDDFGASCRVM